MLLLDYLLLLLASYRHNCGTIFVSFEQKEGIAIVSSIVGFITLHYKK